MHAVTPLVQRLQRYAGQQQPPDAAGVLDACQRLQAACDGMTAEQLVEQQVVSTLAQLAHALLGRVEQQQQQQQHAGGDMATKLVLASMLAVSAQLACAGNVLVQHWNRSAASRAAAATAAAQIQRTALLPRLARQMEAVGRAALSHDGTALSALALARPGNMLEAGGALLLWYSVLRIIWPSSLLASTAAGPVSVAAGRLMVAALMLTELCLARGEWGTHAVQQRARCVVDACRMFLEDVSLGRRQVAVMQAPFLRQVLQSPAYPRLLLALCLFSCSGLLQKHGDAAAQQALQPVALQVGRGLGLGPRLVCLCIYTEESVSKCSVEGDFVDVMRELCTDEACDAIALQQVALMAPMALLLLSTVAACVHGAGEEAALLMCTGADGAHALLMRLEPHHAAAAAGCVVELLACVLQLLALLLVQHATSDNPLHAQTHGSLMRALCCIVALLPAGRGDSAVWLGVWERICSAAESLLRAPLLRGPDSDLLGIALGAVCALVHGGDSVVGGPLLPAAGGDQHQQQAFFSLLATVWKLLPEARQRHHGYSGVAIRAVVANQLEAVLRAARGDSGDGSGASSSAIGASSGGSSGGAHASSGVPWLVLAAHAAHHAGTLLAAAAAPGAAQSAAPADAIRQWCELQASVAEGMRGAMLCSEPGTATPAAPAARLVQLMQELQQELLPALQQGEALLSRAVSAVQREGMTSSNSGDSGGGNNTVAAAGLDPALLAAVDAAAAVSSAEVLHVLQRSFVAMALPQQLQDWAARLSAALPHRYCCNHPGCTNLAGASELALVSGKGCICAGCRTARYCSATCQTVHWPQHRPVCRRLKREAAAAAASAAASASAVRV